MAQINDTSLKLMQTATELIWDSNYDNVGIAEICEKAGVTKGAFYHHFSSKAELFASACALELEKVRRRMDESLSPRFTALEQLENLVELTLRRPRRVEAGKEYICGCPFFTAGAQAGCEKTEIRQIARDMSENGILYYAALVRNLVLQGYLSEPVDEQQAARLLQQFVQGVLMHGRVHQDFEKFSKDLREGIYRLLDLDPRYRYTTTAPLAACEATDKAPATA